MFKSFDDVLSHLPTAHRVVQAEIKRAQDLGWQRCDGGVKIEFDTVGEYNIRLSMSGWGGFNHTNYGSATKSTTFIKTFPELLSGFKQECHTEFTDFVSHERAEALDMLSSAIHSLELINKTNPSPTQYDLNMRYIEFIRSLIESLSKNILPPFVPAEIEGDMEDLLASEAAADAREATEPSPFNDAGELLNDDATNEGDSDDDK